MSRQVVAAAWIFFAVSCGWLFAMPALKAPAVPFPAAEAREEKCGTLPTPAFELDAANRTFVYGSKRFVFQADSTCAVFSESRKILGSYFFVSTPYNGWQPSHGFRVVPRYGGGMACVTGMTASQADRTLRYEGVIPFHAPQAAKPVLRPWSLTVSVNARRNLDFVYRFETPDGKPFGDCGVYFEGGGIQGETRSCTKLADGRSGLVATCRLLGAHAGDTLSVLFHSPCYIHPFKRGQFLRYSPKVLVWHYEIAPSMTRPARPLPPGGVDFLASDDLTIPERGRRNLLLNPYFAQGSNYYWQAGGVFVRHRANTLPTAEVARFGKYSLPGSRQFFYLNTVPVDSGKYVFSFFALGRGSVWIRVSDERSWYNSVKNGTVSLDGEPGQWKRYSFTFDFNKRGAINIGMVMRPARDGKLFLDGLQLEKGETPTPFEAPPVTAGLVSRDEGNFWTTGNDSRCALELSTLEEKTVAGQAEVTIFNFFKEPVRSQNFDFSLKAGQYPTYPLSTARLSQGIYAVRVVFRMEPARRTRTEYFRFAIMPYLGNRHATARIFAMTYLSGMGMISQGNEPLLRRYQHTGVGCFGHACAMKPEALALYRKYNVVPFDDSVVERASSAGIRSKFPGLSVPDGHIYSYVANPEIAHWSPNGILPDYRLMGGWSPEYRRKFIDACVAQLRRIPGLKAYNIGSEWPLEAKKDPHYPDLVVAFAEAVRQVYPDAWVYEAGDCNMDLFGGVAQLDYLLPRWKRYHWRPDVIGCHTYVKDLTQLYPNLRAFLKTAERHGYSETPVAFPEGMHICMYEIPEWGREQVAWMGDSYGGGPLSYDIGWRERLGTAWYMRCYLVYFTIYNRLWCGNCSGNYINAYAMDLALTPYGLQKVPHTLGTLLGNPRRFLGDFTFAADSRCLAWLAEDGCPLAAVWNEDADIDAGRKPCRQARFTYRQARYYDMMGVERKTEKEGGFPISPWPVFIKGRKGDEQAFTRALAEAEAGDTPRRLVDMMSRVLSARKVALVMTPKVARSLDGQLEICGRRLPLRLRNGESGQVEVDLPAGLSASMVNRLVLPYAYVIGAGRFPGEERASVVLARRFHGSWGDVPSIPITNQVLEETGEPHGYDDDFQVGFQVAWDEQALHLRVTVVDDCFAPDLATRGNRWDGDCVQVYFDTRCSARRTGRKAYDSDDYDYTLQPATDGSRCDVYRALSPDVQLTLGIAAPADNEIAKGIPASFRRTSDGYIYEVSFPSWAVLPIRLKAGTNTGFALYVADRDRGRHVKQARSLATEPGKSCYNKPHLWPTLVLVE